MKIVSQTNIFPLKSISSTLGNGDEKSENWGVSSLQQPEASVPNEKDWALLFYMNGCYGDLENSIAKSFLEMEKIGSTDKMHIVAQIGRTPQGKVYNFGQLPDLIDGDWAGVHRYYVKAEPGEQIAAREALERKEDYEIIIKQYPDNPLSHYELGKYLEEHGAHEEAVPCFARAKELGILTVLGEVTEEQKDLKVKKNIRRFNVEMAKALQGIRKKQAPYTQFASQKLKDFGLGSMFKPVTLKRFIKDSMKSFPAKHYCLVMMAHGGAWMGTSNMSPPKIQKALTEGVTESNKETGRNDQLDLLIFNSCYNGNLENLYQFASCGKIGIASEASARASVFSHWGKLLGKFQDAIISGNDMPQDLAKIFVDHYRSENAKVDTLDDVGKTVCEAYNTVVAVDFDKLKKLLGALKDLDSAMNKNNVSHEQFFKHLREAKSYPSDAYRFNFLDFYGDLRDLGDFLNRLSHDDTIAIEVRESAKKTFERLEDCKISESHVSGMKESTGLSIWAPDNALNFVEAKEEYKQSAPMFLKEVPWLERFKNAARKVPLLKLEKAKNIRKRILNMPQTQDPRLKAKVEIALKKIKAQLMLGKEKAPGGAF